MSHSAQAVLQEALQLTPIDRAALIEGLISSLDKPDAAMDALWLKEAEDRMAAYQAGQISSVDANTFFAALSQTV